MVRNVHQTGRRPGRRRVGPSGGRGGVFPGRRYSLESVMAVAGVSSSGRLAELLCVRPELVRQWKRRGLSFSQVDELCCRLGIHVSVIEPDYFDDPGFTDEEPHWVR